VGSTRHLGVRQALQGNLCKHQIVIILMATNVTQEYVIDYCGTWYKSNCGGLMSMFVDHKHVLDGSNFKDDGEVDGDEKVINIDLIKTMDVIVHPTNKVGGFAKQINSIAPLEEALVCLNHTMQEIVEECTQGGVALCDHATSIMKIVALEIQNICLIKANESLHPRMMV
jgi:hypothetical protein